MQCCAKWCNTTYQQAHARQCAPMALSTSHRPNQTEQPCTHYVALHPLRRAAPDQKGCNAYRSGAPPPTTSLTAGNSSPQAPTAASDAATHPRNARQCSSAAIKETTRDRETRAGDKATDRSTHQLLGHSNARTACACQPLRSLHGNNRTISRLLRHTSSHRR